MSKGLCPSISTIVAAKLCRDSVLESPVELNDIDYTWALTYLTLTMTHRKIEDSNMQSLLPRRNTKMGATCEQQIVHPDRGPMGLRSSGRVARIVMDYWAK